MTSLADVEAALTAPGAPFEMEDALVLGERMRVMKRRARSLRDVVAASTQFGDAEHLVFSDGKSTRRIGFAEHARLVASTAAALHRRYGVKKGDRVAILGANSAEWIISFWATVSLGAVAVGLNGWWTADEIRWALGDSAPRVLIIDSKRFERLGGVETGIPTVVMEYDFAELANDDWDASLPSAPIDEDDPAVILYTSGTTGRPKGAVHSHRNVVGLAQLNFFHGARLRGLHPPPADAAPAQPTVLVTSPLFHVSGLHSAAVTGLAAGTRTVYPLGRFDPALAIRLMVEEKVTAWAYTQALLHRLVSHPDAARADLSAIRQLGGGGSPISPRLQEAARKIMTGARQTFGVGYGLTECTALATLHFGDELAEEPTSVGRPMPTVEIEIRDAQGARLPDGEDGEIHIRSPLVMLEYWRRPEETRAAIGPGRWLRSGDIGHMRHGKLTLATRKRDLILRGGENVYPVEIEQRLEAHPGVAEAAVVGVDHEELGQEVKAVVVARPGTSLDAAELGRWVGETLAYFKVPAHWELRSSPLPRNATGKVLKHALADTATREFVEE
jgi:acyl-CoA synthetase (AMP-forming)/AMP-acid ligase II